MSPFIWRASLLQHQIMAALGASGETLQGCLEGTHCRSEPRCWSPTLWSDCCPADLRTLKDFLQQLGEPTAGPAVRRFKAAFPTPPACPI